MNQDQLVGCLIHISRYRFSLVISGLTKMLQKVNEAVSIVIFIKILNKLARFNRF